MLYEVFDFEANLVLILLSTAVQTNLFTLEGALIFHKSLNKGNELLFGYSVKNLIKLIPTNQLTGNLIFCEAPSFSILS